MDDRHLVVHRADFERLYDLDDPRPYYRSLRPLDYRAPHIVAGVLDQWQPRLAGTFGGRRPQLLDFACGFGTIGALLGHELTLGELFAHYCNPDTAGLDAGASRERDRRWFAQRRRAEPGFRVGGLDIARRAVAYACDLGLLDRGFDQDLTAGAAVGELAGFLAETDLVVESGAVGVVLPAAFDSILAGGPRPWFLVFSRPDVDDGPLRAVMERYGYGFETVTPRPQRFRRLIGPEERREVFAKVEALGADPRTRFEEDHFLVHLLLARPQGALASPPLALLRAGLPEGLAG